SFCCQFTQFFTDQLQATKDIANSPTRPSTNLIFGDCLAAGTLPKHYDSGSGGGDPAILYLSSGNGINSASSIGGNIIRPCFQSSLACSMRSFRDETKLHQIKRSPRGSPPRISSVEASLATISGLSDFLKTNILFF